MPVKKLVIALASFLLFTVIIFSWNPSSSENALRFCTWSNYYPDELIARFQNETGIQVTFSYISSNEELLSKLKAGAKEYDLIQPSDYMVRQLIKGDLLQPLDHRSLSNLRNLQTRFKENHYDPLLRFSIPVAWGTTGISVNTKKIAIPERTFSWKQFFESPYLSHASLLDDMREVVTSMLLYQKSPTHPTYFSIYERAFFDLASYKKKIQLFTSEPKALLEREEIWMAHIFSSDGLQLEKASPHIRYFIPEEGATFWTDNLSIPKSALHAEAAHKFIDFLLKPENGLLLSQKSFFASTNELTQSLYPAELKEKSTFLVPPEVERKLFLLEDLGEFLVPLEKLWIRFKSQ